MSRLAWLRPSFKWFDLWVGAYLDVGAGTLYVAPLPCLIFTVQLWDEL